MYSPFSFLSFSSIRFLGERRTNFRVKFESSFRSTAVSCFFFFYWQNGAWSMHVTLDFRFRVRRSPNPRLYLHSIWRIRQHICHSKRMKKYSKWILRPSDYRVRRRHSEWSISIEIITLNAYTIGNSINTVSLICEIASVWTRIMPWCSCSHAHTQHSTAGAMGMEWIVKYASTLCCCSHRKWKWEWLHVKLDV